MSTSIKGRDVDHGRQIKVVNNPFRNNEGLSLLGMPYSVSAYHSPLARPWALRFGIFLSKVLRHVVTHPYMTCKRCTIDFIRQILWQSHINCAAITRKALKISTKRSSSTNYQGVIQKYFISVMRQISCILLRLGCWWGGGRGEGWICYFEMPWWINE